MPYRPVLVAERAIVSENPFALNKRFYFTVQYSIASPERNATSGQHHSKCGIYIAQRLFFGEYIDQQMLQHRISSQHTCGLPTAFASTNANNVLIFVPGVTVTKAYVNGHSCHDELAFWCKHLVLLLLLDALASQWGVTGQVYSYLPPAQAISDNETILRHCTA